MQATQRPEFDALYVRHRAYVHNLLRRFGVASSDLDDAAQDAFERVYRMLDGFEGRAKLETWLYAICWRVACEYRRRLQRPGLPIDSTLCAMNEETDSEELQAALDHLDAGERDLLVLHGIGELTVSGLSELTGGARSTLQRRIERARAVVERGVERASLIAAPFSRASQRRFVDEQALAQLARDADDREHITAGYGFVRCGQTVLLAWQSTPQVKDLAIEAKIVLKAAEEANDAFTYLCVVEPSSAPPDAQGRAILSWILANVGPRCAAAAYVTPGSGIRAIVPSILNSVSFLARDRVNPRFFHELHPALAWLVSQTPGASFDTALSVYERMRARMRDLAHRDASISTPAASAP